MSALHVPLTSALADEESPPPAGPAPEASMSADESPAAAPSVPSPLEAYADARALVKLIQCSQCSRPLRFPVTLPCGNSLCRQCLPPSHHRENISYPAIPSRQTGITCPFPQCHQVHPLDDCSVSVALLKVMEIVCAEVAKDRENAGKAQTSVEEVMVWSEKPDDNTENSIQEQSEKPHARTLPGGRLVSTFIFAEMGELLYTSGIKFVEEGDANPALDKEILERIKDACAKELDCHVCYNTMLDPVTAPCGHTFCRKCLARILDHSTLCPHCRRNLPLPPSLNDQQSNHYLVELLTSLCPEQVAARAEAIALEERTAPGGMDTALFVCTVSLPHMPMILHIFEPRYRLMIRRALEGNRQFGMVAYNEFHTPQGELGQTQFLETGIMLHIEQYRVLADGRSWLFCRGVSRFKVLAHGVHDDYVIGRVQIHSDISLAEEERLEAEETSGPDPASEDPATQLDRMSTAALLAVGLNFVRQAEEQSAGWVSGNIRHIYGNPPDDPALFPYWFGSVAPLPDEEKYKLLPTTSVRERLKIVAHWVRLIESQRWFHGSSCTVL